MIFKCMDLTSTAMILRWLVYTRCYSTMLLVFACSIWEINKTFSS